MNNVNHPNIIRAIELIESQERIYIVMEYIEFNSLRALIDHNKKGINIDVV